MQVHMQWYVYSMVQEAFWLLLFATYSIKEWLQWNHRNLANSKLDDAIHCQAYVQAYKLQVNTKSVTIIVWSCMQLDVGGGGGGRWSSWVKSNPHPILRNHFN